MMLAQLGRRFSFFLGGSLCLADGDHELGLLASQTAPADAARLVGRLSRNTRALWPAT